MVRLYCPACGSSIYEFTYHCHHCGRLLHSFSERENPIKIFFSYAHEDEDLRDELAKHLSILERQGVISAWHDRKIPAGSEWADEIDENLNIAQIILLLVSSDFNASDYCYGIEMERAIERHNAGEARVIPIILRDVVWKGAPFSKLQALPKGAKPVTSWANQDEAFADVVRGILNAIESVDQSKDETGIQGILKKFRERMLAAGSERELQRIKYELQKILIEYPNNPDALVLMDDLEKAINYYRKPIVYSESIQTLEKFTGAIKEYGGVIFGGIVSIGVILTLFAIQTQTNYLRSIQEFFISPTFTSTSTSTRTVTPTFTNTSTLTPTNTNTAVTPSKTTKPTDTPSPSPITPSPSATLSSTPITPTSTTTYNPVIFGGFDNNCVSVEHWGFLRDGNVPPINNGCRLLDSWNMFPVGYRIKILIEPGNFDSSTQRGMYISIPEKVSVLIRYKILVDKLSAQSTILMGVGDNDSFNDSGRYFKIVVPNSQSGPYYEIGEGTNPIYIGSRKQYSFGSDLDVRIEIEDLTISIYANGTKIHDSDIKPEMMKAFWIAYTIPNDTGEISAVISDLQVMEKR